ncbi:unnamed protein product [Taenia asiatica]|uniref:TMV resistance protein N-like n=1 Tax=Taenia asiatica TaxID=60517 RepID=A0A0R3WF79_TAEAS|nr:unnamed protein product [Taenia asiatica]
MEEMLVAIGIWLHLSLQFHIYFLCRPRVLDSWLNDNDVTVVYDDVEELDPIWEGGRCHHSAHSSISDDGLLEVK